MPPQAVSYTGATATEVIVRPQLSVTTGAVGAVADAAQATVDVPSAGTVHVGFVTV